MKSKNRIAIFDMDNTILRGSFIYAAADAFGFADKLRQVVSVHHDHVERSIAIAKLLRGRSSDELLDVARRIPLSVHLDELLQELQRSGYITGIMSDSYDLVTGYFQKKFAFDFTVSNTLELIEGKVTGNIKMHEFFEKGMGTCDHACCKLHALHALSKNYNVSIEQIIMIGDGLNDVCCLEAAGTGIAFCPTCEESANAANHVIHMPDFREVLSILPAC